MNIYHIVHVIYVNQKNTVQELYQKYKIQLHQKGITNDDCSGIDNKYLYLNNILNVGPLTPTNKPSLPPLPQMVPKLIDTTCIINNNKKKRIIDISIEKQAMKKRKIIDISHQKEYIE